MTYDKPQMTEAMTYFHELDAMQHKAIKALGATWREVSNVYPQPEWCSYPDALGGLAGCWSLIGRKIRSRADCGDCELATVVQVIERQDCERWVAGDEGGLVQRKNP